MIQHPNARQSENAMAYDNAVSAVGKICQFHRDSIDASQVAYDSYRQLLAPHKYMWLVTFDDQQVNFLFVLY